MVLVDNDNVYVTLNTSATFDPPIDGLVVISAGDATVNVTINGRTVGINFGTGPISGGQFGAGAVIPLGGCSYIQGHSSLSYIAFRGKRYGATPNSDSTGTIGA